MLFNLPNLLRMGINAGQRYQGSHIGAAGTPDLGYSEDLGRVLGASTTYQGGSNIIPNRSFTSQGVAPQEPNSGRVITTNQTPYGPVNQPKPDLNTTDLNTGGGGGGGQVLGSTTDAGRGSDQGIDLARILADQRAVAQGAYNQGMSSVNRAMDRAKGIRDEGLGVLGQRRGQFEDQYDEGKQDIVQGFQQRMGEGQRAAQGQTMRNRAALQAMGLSGSALLRSQGREQQDQARALATGQDQRAQNERQNQGAFDENNMWADSQESSLKRDYSDTQGKAQDNEGILSQMLMQSAARERGDIGGWIQNMLNQQKAIELSNMENRRAGLDAYSATPFNASLGDTTGMLNSQVSGELGTGGGGGQMAANIPQNQNLLDPRRIGQRVGGSMFE